MDNGASSYRRFLKGDDNGIVEIIRDYKDGLIFFINRYVNDLNTAEDLAEDTFFRLVVRRPHFSEKYSFKTWLYAIGRNLAINHLKREGRRSAVTDIGEWDRAYIRDEEKLILHSALSKLNPDYEKVLYLKFFEELRNDEIGKIMKKNKRQIENLIYQAKQSLKEQLKREGFTYEGL